MISTTTVMTVDGLQLLCASSDLPLPRPPLWRRARADTRAGRTSTTRRAVARPTWRSSRANREHVAFVRVFAADHVPCSYMMIIKSKAVRGKKLGNHRAARRWSSCFQASLKICCVFVQAQIFPLKHRSPAHADALSFFQLALPRAISSSPKDSRASSFAATAAKARREGRAKVGAASTLFHCSFHVYFQFCLF